jgi:DNA-binding transcriptional MocR family regulator
VTATISFATGSLGRVPVLERVLSEGLRCIEPRSLLSYASPLGLPELRRSIARRHRGAREEEVLITSSSQQALSLVFRHIVRAERRILVQEPAYFGVFRILRGRPVVTFGDAAQLETHWRDGDAVYLTSNFQNPTGLSLSQAEKDRIARRASETRSLVVEDNPYDALSYGEQPSTIREAAPAQTIHVSGFSKSLGPGVRVGYVLAPEPTIASLKSLKIDEDIFTCTAAQQLCATALELDYLGELRDWFREKRAVALAALEEELHGTPFTWTRPEGGIFLQGRLEARVPLEAVATVAERDHGLLLERDHHLWHDGRSRNTTRVNFVQNDGDVLREGVRRLGRALRAFA